MQTATQTKLPTHVATLNNRTIQFHADDFDSVVPMFVAAAGGGVPKIDPLHSGVREIAPPLPADPLVSIEGRDRAARDAQLAVDNGFVLRPPVYSLGTTVNETGVENAARSQREHKAKPWAQDVCAELIEVVAAEKRVDLPAVRLSDLRMDSEGQVVFPESHHIFSGVRLPINQRIFGSLMGRFPCASGNAYLSDCPTKLRSINFNHWAVQLRSLEVGGEVKGEREVVLRTREQGGIRFGYAAVSPKYTPYDADTIARALSMAFPSDAKGVADYDGERLRVEGMWHTDVVANEFVAGEIFKAGVVVRTDDTGSGSIRIQSVIWRNLCRNLIILDKAIGVDVSLRHIGSVQELAARFREAFGKALSSVNGFRVAWNAAFQESDSDLLRRVQGTTSENLSGLSPEAALPGIFNGILERELVPVRGRKADVVPKLLEMHRQDERAADYGVSRASVVNAFTRYAHQVETDPFWADATREGAGRLLSGSRGGAPAPLPYVALV